MVESGELVTTIRSAEGIRQGDVLSSLLFSHTVLPLYSLACSEFPQVSAVAIMDDVEFVGPFSQLFFGPRSAYSARSRVRSFFAVS